MTSKKEIIPFLHRLLVKPDSLENADPVFNEAAKAGIAIPKELLKREESAVVYGTVLKVGETCFKDYRGEPWYLNPGDRIIYARHGGKQIKDPNDPNQVLLILNDEDVVAVIKDEVTTV